MNKKQIIAIIGFIAIGISIPFWFVPQEHWWSLALVFVTIGLLFLFFIGVILFIDWLGTK
jgi:hypothetical protein